MPYIIEYDPKILWRGRTQQFDSYTLHRARIEDAEDGSYTYGYLLRWSNGWECDIVEAYSEYFIEPDNGFHGDEILDCRVARRPLPHAACRDIKRFSESFANFCAEQSTPLQLNEILV